MRKEADEALKLASLVYYTTLVKGELRSLFPRYVPL
jgi:hypothetical protein